MSKAVVGGVMETGLNDGLCFDQLEVGSSMSIIVMVCRSWDCDNVHGRYMSTDYIFSDRNGDSIHATARSNIAHYFVNKLKEGSTVFKKVSVDHGGFERYPFQIVQFEDLEVTNNKYFVDVIGYVTTTDNVSTTSTGKRTLEFNLRNERGGHMAVTLWGKLGESFIAQKAKKVGVYTVTLSSMSVKHYLESLALSSSSSTLIIDSNNIPLLESFNASLRYRLMVDVKDMTSNFVVVLFDEAGKQLVKKSAKSLLDEQELSTNNDDMVLPEEFRCLIGGTYMFELRSHTYYQYGDYESFNCAQVLLPGSASYASSSSVDDILEPATVPALSSPVKKAPQFGVVTPDKRADKRSSNLDCTGTDSEGVLGKAGHALSMDVKTDLDMGFEVNVTPGKRDPLSEQEDDVDDKDCGEDSGAGTVGKKRRAYIVDSEDEE
ncbi:hypothetical protein SSX86_024003 [Deinandra increscens subsp. villosa]|uniref:Replication factor A C-terminal domain-containing protein n=1 Tax=Deinandra increscens subsp. villosa TaxID=3103831 RepID=A0AAP0GPA3_9ASTR